MLREAEHPQSPQAPNHQPIDAKRVLAGAQNRRQPHRQGRQGADLRVEARRAAALDQGRPHEQFAVPGVVGDENEIGAEEVAGIEPPRVSPKEERDVGRQEDEDDQRRRAKAGPKQSLDANRSAA